MKQEDQPGASLAEVPSEHDASLGFFCHVSLRISFILYSPGGVLLSRRRKEGTALGPQTGNAYNRCPLIDPSLSLG